MMRLKFTKMHGLGNDFMVIEALSQPVDLTRANLMTLSHRHTGVGFDQCLVIENSDKAHIDFFYRIFNADGSEVGQCGNGARCLARFIQQKGLSSKKNLTIETKTTQMKLCINDDETVTVNMGHPNLLPKNIPLNLNQQDIYSIPVPNTGDVQLHAISVGNPHAVMIVPTLAESDVLSLGKEISKHPLFLEGTNVGFMEIKAPDHIQLRVYERGCGETSACGSGAVAAVAIGQLFHHLAKDVRVSLSGGDLWISWPDVTGPIFLTGPASFVYEGELLV
jgi:diaminopimelate epimerase